MAWHPSLSCRRRGILHFPKMAFFSKNMAGLGTWESLGDRAEDDSTVGSGLGFAIRSEVGLGDGPGEGVGVVLHLSVGTQGKIPCSTR